MNSFEGNGILVSRAKAAVNQPGSLVTIQRVYQVLPPLIQKMEATTYTIKEAYDDISKLDLKDDCVGIGTYIKKRLNANSDLESIVRLQRKNVSPALYADLQRCQPTSAPVERSFSMLNNLLRKDRPFLPENVEKYLCLYYNKHN